MARSLSFTVQMRELLPLVPMKEKKRFFLLLGFAVLIALSELALTGLVALLAAIFASPEAVLASSKFVWARQYVNLDFVKDPRLLALAVLCSILGAIALKNVFAVVQQWQQSLFSESVGAAARMHVFRFYQRAPFLWTVQNGVADMNFGMAATIQLAITLNMLLQVATNMLLTVTLFAGLILVAPVPSLFFLLVLGVGGSFTIKAIRGILDRCSGESYHLDYDSNKITHLALHGLKEMRLNLRENALYAAFRDLVKRTVLAKARLQTFARLPVCSIEILGFSTLVGVMCFLIFIQNAGMATISGTMGFLAAVAWRSLPVANRLVEYVTVLRAGIPYLEKVATILRLERSMETSMLPLADCPSPMPFNKQVALEHVSFRYPDAQSDAIHDVSMTIPMGTMVGLVGFSGSGKSTLINILTGLMPPDSGELTVDGVAVSRDNAASWLKHIGYVSQAPYILDASLAENVALSRWGESIDRDRVLECCTMAALDFVDDLEHGIDTVLGDRGTRLSGGQAQRVAIARALYSEPDLIIFDEATSSLDIKNEKAIHETILSLRDKVTMVIIAHRLSTVEGCDMLVWMDKGKVLLQGSAGMVLPHYEVALNVVPEESC